MPVIFWPRLARWLIVATLIATAARLWGNVAIEVMADLHSASSAPHRISIGGHRLLVPENLIRDKHQRRSGDLPQLDLYMTWPELSGFSFEQSTRFNALDKIILMSIGQETSHPVAENYSHFTERGESGPSGLEQRPIIRGGGFEGEVIMVGERPPAGQFLARCFRNEMADAMSAPCERRLPFERNLVLIYRFPAHLLDEWRVLDERIRERARELLQDG